MLKRVWRKMRGSRSSGSKNTKKKDVERSGVRFLTKQKQPAPGDDSSTNESDDHKTMSTTMSNSSESPKDLKPETTSPEVEEKETAKEKAAPGTTLEPIMDECFPAFVELENFSELEDSDASDDESVDEEEIQRKAEKYETKEDQDVAVFLEIANRMSLKSLLHLLQGHVRAANMPQESLTQYAELAEEATSRHRNTVPQKPLSRPKKFRWAELKDGHIREVVHTVESWKDDTNIWWQNEEMQEIREELIDTITFFRKYRSRYISSVEILAKGDQSEQVIEANMHLLLKDSFARGLESHIVKLLSDNRRRTVKAVIQEYRDCKAAGDDYDTTSSCLRQASLFHSRLNRGFAEKMGECDHIDALKANMSRWTKEG